MRRSKLFLFLWVLIGTVAAANVKAQPINSGKVDRRQTDLRLGTLSGRFVYDGEPPIPKDFHAHFSKIDVNQPQQPGPDGKLDGVERLYRDFLKHKIRPMTTDESLLIGKDGGIANVAVWVVSKDIPWNVPPSDQPPVTIRLKEGTLSPRCTVVTVGQPLLVENHDPLVQNFAADFTRALNPPASVMLQPGAVDPPYSLSFRAPEPYPARSWLGRAIWAKGWVFVHNNPFVAVSQADGSFTLANLPPGEWEFQVWHERSGFIRHWPKGRFKQTIKLGNNSLGTVSLKPEVLGQKAAQVTVTLPPPPKNREQIGEVLGRPVYRDEVKDDTLHGVFLGPVWTKYREAHRAAITPTEDELKHATEVFDRVHRERLDAEGGEAKIRDQMKSLEERLARPDLTDTETEKLESEHRTLREKLKRPASYGFAQFMLDNWKFQKHLYDEYGGGRILWQQAGLEAFDAMRTCLESLEKKGEFKVTDAKLRAKLYEYWTRQNHPSLFTDKEVIRREFVEPEWIAPAPEKVHDQKTTQQEGVIEEVSDKLIVFEDGRVISTDAATKYARLTDKGEEPAERKELKAGLRVRYDLAPGKATTKFVILPAKKAADGKDEAPQDDAKGDLRSETRRGQETRAERETRELPEELSTGKNKITAREVEDWLGDLASDSAPRQAQAAAELEQRLANQRVDDVDPHLIQSLIRLLGRDEVATHGPRTQRVAAWCQEALKQVGPPAVAELIQAASQGDPKVRGRAAECLGWIKAVGPRGVETLIALLEHPDYEARGPAASALKELTAEPTLIPKLIEASERGTMLARCWAIGVLGRLKDDRVDAALLKALDAPERELRGWAAHAVMETPHPKLGAEIISRVKTDDREIRQNLEFALVHCAKQIVTPLLAGLTDADARVRAACVNAFDRVLPGEANRIVPGLVPLLKDDDANVRRSVFQIVRSQVNLFDRESLVGPLVKGLSDADAHVRAAASVALKAFAEQWRTDRRPVEPLLKALDDSKPEVVVGVIHALTAFREPKAIPQLVHLAGVGGQTGAAASNALGVFGDQRGRDVLRQNLAKREPSAIEALGMLRDRDSIPQFIELLKDSNESVRTAAAEALALNPDPRAVEPLIASLKEGVGGGANVINQSIRPERNNSTRAIADALGRIGDPRGITALIERIDDAGNLHERFSDLESTSAYPRRLDDRLVHHPFAWPLYHAGFLALPELAKGLSSPSHSTRQVCAWVLDNLASQGGLEPTDFDSIRPALLVGLHDADPVVRYCLVKTISDLKWQDAEPILLELLESPLPKESETRTSTVIVGSPPPNELSAATQIQVEVIRALCSLKTDRARDALLTALQHSEPAVRSAAAGHLGAFPAAVTVEPLIKALSDPGACAEAARVLGHVGDPRAVAPLIELLKSHPDPTVQTHAAQSLGLLGATEAKPVLREVLDRIPAVSAKSDTFQTQLAAAISLVQLHEETGTERLKELLDSSDSETRSNVASSLSRATYFSGWRPSAKLLHEPTREVLRHFAEHAPDTSTRLQLIEALGGQLDDTTREFLERLARDPNEPLGWAAWRVLVRPNPAAYEEQLLVLLDKNEDDVRRDVVWFLAQIPTPRVTDRLLALTSDPKAELRVAVVNALGRHRSPKVDPKLLELSTNDPSPHVRAGRRVNDQNDQGNPAAAKNR